jgi:hypothetical protein
MSFGEIAVAVVFALVLGLAVLFAFSLRHHWWDENSDW